MRALLGVARLLANADRWAMARGAAMFVAVLLMGAALLGLSGWFITATGLAGLAGVGIAFDVFRPSAGVRFLALGRAAARYGERLLTHDATLRALATLRVVLLRGLARRNARGLAALRGEGALTRIMSDVDALDGVVLRLILPIAAALVTHVLVFAGLWWLVGMPVALVTVAAYSLGAALILAWHARSSVVPSAQAEEAGQRLRRGQIDMIRDRAALILAARLTERERDLLRLDEEARRLARRMDRAERDAGALLSLLVASVAMGAFVTGAWLVAGGETGPARAVIGLFVALALAESVLPLRRGTAELGRMVAAATRVAPQIDGRDRPDVGPPPVGGRLLVVDRSDVTLALSSGQAVALTGPSGIGKTTLLMRIAGLDEGSGILIKGQRPEAWPEDALRQVVGVLPQRSALIAGTIRDNMSLGGTFADAAMWAALDAVALSADIVGRGGLDATLGEGGAGLSGGQARRLALARNILKKPEILLLDEPLEGLDPTTADAVLRGLREALPEAAILAVMHRGAEHPIFDRRIEMTALR